MVPPRDQVEAEADRAERLEERAHALEGRAARRAGEARAGFDAAYATIAAEGPHAARRRLLEDLAANILGFQAATR